MPAIYLSTAGQRDNSCTFQWRELPRLYPTLDYCNQKIEDQHRDSARSNRAQLAVRHSGALEARLAAFRPASEYNETRVKL
jgi:hypothetical protein